MHRTLLAASLLFGALACNEKDDTAPQEFEGDAAGECTDGADNDQDGAFDCDDPDCVGSPDCEFDTSEPPDNNPPSAPGVVLAPAAPTTVDDLECNVVVASEDPDGDPVTYTYTWVVDGVEVFAGRADTYTADRTVKGQVIQCLVQASDGWDESSVAATDAVTIANSVPSLTAAGISPDPATSSDTLRCAWSGFSDADEDDDLSLITWKVNDVGVGSSPELTSGFVRGDVVTCEVTAFDGETEGGTVGDALTIENSPPVLLGAFLTPTDAEVTDTLTCTPGSVQDRDGDFTIAYAYAWTVDGAAVASTTRTLGPSFFSEGAAVACTVTPNDGLQDGLPVTSNAVTILSGPVLTTDLSSWDFGMLDAGCTDTVELTLTNTGTSTLLIRGVTWSGDSSFSSDLVAPTTLATGASTTFAASFAPVEEGAFAGTLTLTSNAPAGPATLTFSGEGAWAELTQSEEASVDLSEVDILFAVDKSGSMVEEITGFLDSLASFDQRLLDNGADFRLAGIVADDGCVVGDDLWVDQSFSASDAADVMDTMIGGSYGSNTELAFTLFEAALDETGSGGCNEGLIRDDAWLHLVGVSDEPEQSVNPWTYYLAEFQALKAAPEMVVFDAIGGDYPSGCSTASAYTGMYEATAATGGSFLSICTADWTATMESLADTIATPNSVVIELEGLPWDVSAITVTVEGVDIAGSWTWDEADNRILISALAVEDGDTIEITYQGLDLGC